MGRISCPVYWTRFFGRKVHSTHAATSAVSRSGPKEARVGPRQALARKPPFPGARLPTQLDLPFISFGLCGTDASTRRLDSWRRPPQYQIREATKQKTRVQHALFTH